MSTSSLTTDNDSRAIIRRIEQYLIDAVADEHGYFKSKEIAQETGISTKKVAAHIHTVDEISNQISISKWGYSKSTTWLIEQVD